MPELKYFEVEFSNGNEDESVCICIRGTAKPTVEEANEFLSADVKMYGKPVVSVTDIVEEDADRFYDLSAVDEWPIFSKK